MLAAKNMIIIASILLSTPALAVWSFGTAVNSGSAGVSMQAQPSYYTGVHASYLFLGRRPAITLDYQFFSGRLWATRMRGYVGAGAETALAADNKDAEIVSLRAPVGAQYDFLSSDIQIFGELTPVFGPLPDMNNTAQFALGARARF